MEEIGRSALKLTNAFRLEKKLPPLMWAAGMYPVALEHR
tara:strand:+ start:779 stop:895 length:117 start_codon:yes stop_codon:yes gene_type:complete